MADLSSFTHKWRAVTNPDHRSDANKITKRNRQPVSCQPCRARKLKCDRGHPCDGCTKRGEASTCVYGRTSTTTVASSGNVQRKDDMRSSAKAQDRLKYLEDLVRGMVESPTRNYPSPEQVSSTDSNSFQTPETDGSTNEDSPTGPTYTSSTHWSAILQHISELRNDFEIGNVGYEQVPDTIDYSKPDALFGGHRPQSLDQILNNHLPPRIQIDRRVTQYFSAPYMIIPFLHAGQFRRQYEKFWEDPLNTNVLWISKMFSICCLAAGIAIAASQDAAYKAEMAQARESFEAASGECLVLGNYSKPQPHAVEALALFLQCRYGRSLDPQPEVALMFGMQTRLAYMLGYHRDGSNFPGQITPFEAEMRRRVWAMLRQFDLLVAFQLGVPNSVPPESWDTANPSNLLDSDFDEDTKVLPESRPETEPTTILYFIVKSRLMDVYSKITHNVVSFKQMATPMTEIMQLDKAVRDAVGKIPEALRLRPMSQSVTDPAHIIMVRVNISFLWQKSLCVLHRKYMVVDGNEHSHKTCIEAATAMCETLLDVYPEFQPGGIFAHEGWMLSSFTIVDFLLVSMILCLAMSVSRRKFLSKGGTREAWGELEETKRVLTTLSRCQKICIELGARSREARRVSRVLSTVLPKLKDGINVHVGEESTSQNSANTSTSTRPDIPYKTSAGYVDRDGISLKPLSLSERTTSTNMSNGMFPPSWLVDKNDVYGEQTKTNSTSSGTEASTPWTETINKLHAACGGLTDQPYMNNAAAPATFNMDMDMGFFDNFMEDAGGNGNIDWTQLDQFTGVFGSDPTLPMFDMMGTQGFMMQSTPGSAQDTDPDTWQSTPFLGIGARNITPTTNSQG